MQATVEKVDKDTYKIVDIDGLKVDIIIPPIQGIDNKLEKMWTPVPTLCNENYFYCSSEKKLPVIDSIPDEWYQNQKNGQIHQLEFRKRQHPKFGYENGWYVEPVLFTENEEKRFDGFKMSDMEVMMLWMKVINSGGIVSDGIINLFDGKKK